MQSDKDPNRKKSYIVPLEGEEDKAAEEQQGASAEGDRQSSVGLASDFAGRLSDGGLASEGGTPTHGDGVHLSSAPQAGEVSLEGEAGGSHPCHGCSAGSHFST